MADNLDDGEFWLPSQFLTDDDILMDFKKDVSGFGSASGSGSDLDSLTGSAETESDEDDQQLAGLTRPVKATVLSSSPQSTLCGFVGKEGSSRGSPNGPVSPPLVAATKSDGGATWDLLYKAAGEVARIKMRTETKTTATTGASVGTGFFDCSNSSKGLLCPPPPPPRTATTTTNNNTYPSFYSQPQFQPLSHLQLQLRQQHQVMMKQSNGPQFNRLTRINSNCSSRPLGLPPPAWPPLQGPSPGPNSNQNQNMSVVPPMYMGQPGPKRESVGTGVFLPRRVTTTTSETRKRPEGNPTKMRSGKGLQSQQKRSSRPPTTVSQIEIQLPQEWTY